MDLKLYTCDVLYSGMGTPRVDGAVVLSEELVVATGTPDELRQMYPQAQEAGHVPVIAPRPANGHTHLDLSTMPYTELDYVPWIGQVIAHARTGARNLQAAELGLQQLEAPLVGDIVTREDVMEHLLSREDVQGVAYWEVLGPDPAQAEAIFQATTAKIEQFRRLQRPSGVRVGLSPHTPHTVSHKLMQMLVAFAHSEGLPLQIHVAEHPSELAFHSTQDGPLAEALQRAMGVTPALVTGRAADPGRTPVGYLAELGVLEARPTLIHMVNVTENDVQLVARAGCPVVTCPRSNQALDCGTFDWPLFAKHGVEIGLGTDSVGSGRTLSILDELVFARQLYGERVPLRSLVRAAVKGNARVLGLTVPFLRRGEPASHVHFWHS